MLIAATAQEHGLAVVTRNLRHFVPTGVQLYLGKGSHGILKLDGRKTMLRNPKDELKTGTLHAMLKQLGLSDQDL